MGEGAIVQQRDAANALRYGGSDSPYEIRRCKGDKDQAAGLTLAYLILIFLTVQLNFAHSVTAATDLLNATRQFLDEFTSPS